MDPPGDKSPRKTGSDETCSTGSTAVGDASFIITNTNPDKVDPLPHLCPPSEDESFLYYYGLPSRPRLLGRASAGVTIWESHTEQFARVGEVDGYRVADKKAISAIGPHSIRTRWADLRMSVVHAIRALPWSSVDVCRIGSTKIALLKRPVVVWIGVDLGEFEESDLPPWETIAGALRACRRVLDKAGLLDVDCQIRVSRVVPLVGPQLLDPLPFVESDWHSVAQKFSSPIGLSLSPFERPTLQGTLGVYLSVDGPDNMEPPLLGLTCRHVALPLKDCHQNEDYRHQPGADKKIIGLNKASEAQDLIKVVAYHKGNHPNDYLTQTLTSLHDAIKHFEQEDARAIGHVFLSPPIGQGLEPLPWTRDWCLLRLDRTKFPRGVSPINVVDLRTRMTPDAVNELLNPNPQNRHVFAFPSNGLLRISGVIPLAEIRNPKTLDKSGEECILVGKRGSVTDLTWGCPSELESVVRNCMPDGSEFVSYEWAIHGSMPDKKVPFSAGGDSGAAVFDTQGRLGGFVTTGTRPASGRFVDITYATPAVLVLADIEEKLGMKVALL